MSVPHSEPELPRDPEVEEAAAEWLILHDRGLTPTQQDAFLQWLSRNPAHRESFERHRQMWSDFDRLAQWRPEHSVEPNPDLLARHRPLGMRRWVAPLALAAAAAVAVVVWSSANRVSAPSVLTYEAPEYRQELLPDGSVLDLNVGAHAVVQFSPQERRVLLVQGEAQFTVAKNPARPFVVRAAGVDVRAVGTAFNVKLAGPGIEVLVTEGVVQVERQAALTSGAAEAPEPTILAALAAGQRTTVSVLPAASAPVVEQTSEAEMAQMLEWKPLLLDFESVPLVEVVATFNQRSRMRLEIADASLSHLPIVASIRSDNVEGFVRLLEATMGVRAERTPSGVIELHRAR